MKKRPQEGAGEGGEQGQQSGSGTSQGQNAGAGAGGGTGTGKTGQEAAGGYGSELDDKFAEFDRMILAERDATNDRNNDEGSDTHSQGGYGNGEGEGEPEDAPLQTAMIETSPQSSGGTLKSPLPGDSSSLPPPADVGDGQDDDIIARQLREAAMKEQDPELRAKLWDEYRKYKRGA